MRSISAEDKVRPDLGGGITSSGSVAVMRRIISLFAMSPGTIAREPLRSLMASSRTSSRSFALRELSSAPWQLKHLLEMTGRIWELKSTGSEDDCLFGEAAGAGAINIQTVIVRMTGRTRCGKDLLIRSIQKRFLDDDSTPDRAFLESLQSQKIGSALGP